MFKNQKALQLKLKQTYSSRVRGVDIEVGIFLNNELVIIMCICVQIITGDHQFFTRYLNILNKYISKSYPIHHCHFNNVPDKVFLVYCKTPFSSVLPIAHHLKYFFDRPKYSLYIYACIVASKNIHLILSYNQNALKQIFAG